jgi:hypothetical protein
MAEVSPAAIREIEAALARYEREVRAAGLAPDTVKTYLQHAKQFVRWLNGDFTPGRRAPA